MQDFTKFKKQATIVATVVAGFLVIAFFVYLWMKPSATCNDQKQNQNERGVDCGGPCSPCMDSNNNLTIVVQEIAFVDGGNGTYDVIAKIYNSEDILGVKNFNYTFTLKDESGTVIASQKGSSFILPLDSKYLVELGLATKDNSVPKLAEISITDLESQKLGEVQKPQLGVYSKKFDKDAVGVGSIAQGIVRNDSGYDLKKVSLVVVLRSANGKIVAVSATQKNMLRSGEQQDFRLNWPYALTADVQSMEVDAQSNVLDPNNFTVTR